VGVPAHVVRGVGLDDTFIDLNHTDIPDPLEDEIRELERRIRELESRVNSAQKPM
jgi:cell division septum initiation protein DivIVA